MFKLNKVDVALIIIAGFTAVDANAAGYSGILSVARVRVHPAETYVGTSLQPSDTCSEFGEFYKFDHTTPHGKSLLATLLTAKATGKNVEIWYLPSTASGTNQTNGCNTSTMAVLTGVSLP
jgi:hypothetical protein